MAISDNLNPIQFRNTADLLKAQSLDAQSAKVSQEVGSPIRGYRGPNTDVNSIYERKAQNIAADLGSYRKLDKPLREGTIDPVILDENGAVYEGHHRIVRADQIRVGKLPTISTRTKNFHLSQKNAMTWDM